MSGALRHTAQGSYRSLIEAGLDRDLDRVRDTAVATGFLRPSAVAAHGPEVSRIVATIDHAMNKPSPFDFGERAFVLVRKDAKGLLADRTARHLPPTDTLFVKRKVSGTALLAARLKARVAVRELAGSAVGGSRPTRALKPKAL